MLPSVQPEVSRHGPDAKVTRRRAVGIDRGAEAQAHTPALGVHAEERRRRVGAKRDANFAAGPSVPARARSAPPARARRPCRAAGAAPAPAPRGSLPALPRSAHRAGAAVCCRVGSRSSATPARLAARATASGWTPTLKASTSGSPTRTRLSPAAGTEATSCGRGVVNSHDDILRQARPIQPGDAGRDPGPECGRHRQTAGGRKAQRPGADPGVRSWRLRLEHRAALAGRERGAGSRAAPWDGRR